MKKIEAYFTDKSDPGIEDIEGYKKNSLSILSTENMSERTSGLLKLPFLEKSEGLLINKCNSIHTFGMKYDLDIIYLDRRYNAVKLVEQIKPRRMSLCLFAKHTLELPSGEIDRLGIKKGMALIFDQKL